MLGKNLHYLKIIFSEELNIDYMWDKNSLNIPKDVPCLCEKQKCRKFLMKALKSSSESEKGSESSLIQSANLINTYA